MKTGVSVKMNQLTYSAIMAYTEEHYPSISEDESLAMFLTDIFARVYFEIEPTGYFFDVSPESNKYLFPKFLVLNSEILIQLIHLSESFGSFELRKVVLNLLEEISLR